MAEDFEKNIVSNSKLYMLRCVIAMAHADGIIAPEERAYVTAIMNRIPLTPEQRQTLENDFDHAQDMSDLFRHINDPRYRSQVSYFARLMAFKDGVLHPSEQELLDRLHAMTTAGLDIKAIKADVQKAVTAEMNLHDIKVDQNRPTRGGHFIPWFELLDEFLLRIGIDLMRD